MDSENEYDRLPYPSATFPQTSPERLSTIATLYGVDAPPTDRCSVLELGCGDGTNLLAQAYAFPGSSFHGIDLSQTHIGDAKRTSEYLGLNNITFQQADILDLSPSELGTYDFIISHGLYSWVPEPVRERVLEIYSAALSANGVGYISFNAFPGCRMRQVLWDAIKPVAARESDPLTKVEVAIEFANKILDATDKDAPQYSLLAREVQSLHTRSPAKVFHDDLSEFNDPFYFSEFASQIGAHGLRYVAEAEIRNNEWTAAGGGAPSDAADQIAAQEFSDFVEFQKFRWSIICRDSVPVSPFPLGERLRKCFLSANLTLVEPASELLDQSIVQFTGPKGVVEANEPAVKCTLALMARSWPRQFDFESIASHLREKNVSGDANGFEESLARMESACLQLVFAQIVNASSHRFEYVDQVGTMPTASSFARWQIDHGCDYITTVRITNLEIKEPLVLELITSADGNTSRDRIASNIAAKLEVAEDQKDQVAVLVDKHLEELRKVGLIIES